VIELVIIVVLGGAVRVWSGPSSGHI
jgi:hypothetical protein